MLSTLWNMAIYEQMCSFMYVRFLNSVKYLLCTIEEKKVTYICSNLWVSK